MDYDIDPGTRVRTPYGRGIVADGEQPEIRAGGDHWVSVLIDGEIEPRRLSCSQAVVSSDATMDSIEAARGYL